MVVIGSPLRGDDILPMFGSTSQQPAPLSFGSVHACQRELLLLPVTHVFRWFWAPGSAHRHQGAAPGSGSAPSTIFRFPWGRPRSRALALSHTIFFTTVGGEIVKVPRLGLLLGAPAEPQPAVSSRFVRAHRGLLPFIVPTPLSASPSGGIYDSPGFSIVS